MKGTSGAAAQRRKVGSTEQNRVFSRSSISYRPNTGVSPCTPPPLLPTRVVLTRFFCLIGDTRIYACLARADTDLCIFPRWRLCECDSDIGYGNEEREQEEEGDGGQRK